MTTFRPDITLGLYLTVIMENAALLVAIIQNATDGIITIDKLGRIESINPAACKLFGYAAIEVIGCNVSMLLPVEHRRDHAAFFKNFKQLKVVNTSEAGREIYGLTKHGGIFPFCLGLSEVQYSGRKIYTGFIHDLTREKASESQLKAYAGQLELDVLGRTQSLNETVKALERAKEEVSMSLMKEKELGLLKSRFVSIASHEFRTPLTSIQLSASLIEQYTGSSATSSVAKHIQKINVAVGNLTGILNDFLSIEKLEAGMQEVAADVFDLVKLSEDITEDMQAMAKPHQNIIYQHTGTLSTTKLDRNLVKCCIVNLISNAIKYSGENTFIDFNTEIGKKGCMITIRDDGIGIPKVDHKHLFEPFFRAHNTGTIPGTGLGLNIVARYVGLMGGVVDFQSSIKQGTRFTISFPLS
jgi:two-component system sensor kinase FixL